MGDVPGISDEQRSTAQKSSDPTLQAVLAAEARMGGTLGVAAYRLDGDEDAVRYRDARPFKAASTIKVYVLLALLEAVDAGELALDEALELRPEDAVTGSGVLKSLTPGHAYSLHDLAMLMIIVSDNTATNMLIERLGLERVNGTIEAHGWRETRLAGLLQRAGGPPGDKASWSTTSPRDLADHFARLWRGELLSAAATETARGIYLRQEYTGTLGRYLPYDADDLEEGVSSLAIASKSGSVRGVRNDAGVISGTHGAYVLAVMSADCPDRRFHADNLGNLAIADVSRALFQRFAGTAPSELEPST